MAITRPPRPSTQELDETVRATIFKRIEQTVAGGLVGVVALYLSEETYPNQPGALEIIEERYGIPRGALTRDHAGRLGQLIEGQRQVELESGSFTADLDDPTTVLARVPPRDKAWAFLAVLPDAELLTALELRGHQLIAEAEGSRRMRYHLDLFAYLEKVFRNYGLPYTAARESGISWKGEPTVHEQAIQPALDALADPRLVHARADFQKARTDFRRGDFRDAGKAAGDAVETAMAVLLDTQGLAQPQTAGGETLVQAGKLFDALKSAGLLNQDRDYALIFAPIKVRHACAHGQGVRPTSVDPSFIQAGIAAAAVALVYLASKLPQP